MWLSLQREEELLVQLQLLAGVLVESLEIERVLGIDLLVRQQTADMTAKVFLVLDDFIEGDLVLDQKCDFDIKLIDVLLGELVLSDLLDDRLA